MLKTIVVNATAAHTGGALTILRDFLDAISYQKKDLSYKYIIFTSFDVEYEISSSISIVNVGKKNYLQRLIWDYISFSRFLSKQKITPDLIISFQNTGVVYSRTCPQLIYFHNSFSLLPEKWSPFVKNERILWFYTNVYPFFVKALIKGNTLFVVQAEWIKNEFAKKFNVSDNKIFVIKPDVVGLPVLQELSLIGKDKLSFFFPATAFKYKNHQLIFSILDEIKNINPEVSKLISINLTLTIEDIDQLGLTDRYNEWKDSIVLLGYISKEEMIKQFNICRALLFPSRIETLGLPLLEAASIGKFIIASDLAYAHETLGEYKSVSFIDPYNANEWAMKVIDCSKNENHTIKKQLPKTNSWLDFINLIDTITE